MTAFVTRSILLFAAEALKYNKSYLWTCEPGAAGAARCTWKQQEQYSGDAFIKHRRRSFPPLRPAIKISIRGEIVHAYTVTPVI